MDILEGYVTLLLLLLGRIRGIRLGRLGPQLIQRDPGNGPSDPVMMTDEDCHDSST